MREITLTAIRINGRPPIFGDESTSFRGSAGPVAFEIPELITAGESTDSGATSIGAESALVRMVDLRAKRPNLSRREGLEYAGMMVK